MKLTDSVINKRPAEFKENIIKELHKRVADRLEEFKKDLGKNLFAESKDEDEDDSELIDGDSELVDEDSELQDEE